MTGRSHLTSTTTITLVILPAKSPRCSFSIALSLSFFHSFSFFSHILVQVLVVVVGNVGHVFFVHFDDVFGTEFEQCFIASFLSVIEIVPHSVC